MASNEYSVREANYDNNSALQPLLSSDRERINQASQDHLSRILTDETTWTYRTRKFLQHFLTSKYGHYFVMILVTLDVGGIFADFLISLHICEHTCGGAKGGNVRMWERVSEGLDVLSLVFSCLFMVELLCSIFAFGFVYFKSKFHCFDATAIIASFLVDVLTHGTIEEAGSLIIILRLFRVFKIVEESGTVAQEELEGLNEKIEKLEKENDGLRQRLETSSNRI